MAPLLYTLALLLTRALAAPGVTSSTTPLPENVCGMPLETGRCDAIKHRFAFDAAKNECVSFVYGGCGGNGNNFVSLADCQAACPKKTSLAAAPTAAVKPVTQEEMPQADQPPTPAARATCAACPNEAYLTHYQELGCQPIFSEDNKCCAVRYNCGNRALQSKDKCYHEGKAYEIGSEIPNDATPSCLVHCRCTQTEFDKAPRMNCISIECPMSCLKDRFLIATVSGNTVEANAAPRTPTVLQLAPL
ncbi:kunitz-type protease inhibitor 1-like [Neocloeon triangulifer]|uniref:kunitz-type protease inhibitor 1-like n=1 Tax=Neocloeon triangulifer TaxID=2078957 RepID=UPI00286EDDD3|nr:kunitz-type protease inhibitor 1-like [Neocloeon triangulifer]